MVKPSERFELHKKIKLYNGLLFTPTATNKTNNQVKYIICNSLTYEIYQQFSCSLHQNKQSFSYYPIFVTPNWLNECIIHNQILNPNKYFKFIAFPSWLSFIKSNYRTSIPLSFQHTTSINTSQSMKFCLSMFNRTEKSIATILIQSLGGIIEKRFTRNITHLICKYKQGAKYEKAIEYNTPVLSIHWIIACALKKIYLI